MARDQTREGDETLTLPILFMHDAWRLTKQVTPGCEWVMRGKGSASIMRDGVPCLIRQGILYKSLDEAKAGPPKEWPLGWIRKSATELWVSIGPGDAPHAKAMSRQWPTGTIEDGPHELCGPGIGSNNDRLREPTLIRHGQETVLVGRGFDQIRDYLQTTQIKGIVFALPDGRMCKIRRVDFGFAWGAVAARVDRRMRRNS